MGGPAARKRELNQLARDAELALSELLAENAGPAAEGARELLRRVAKQDVEEDGEGGVRIRQGVAKDRGGLDRRRRYAAWAQILGRTLGRLQEAPHGEAGDELITAVEVSAANANDAEQALPLLEQQVGAGLAPAEVVADHA